MVSTPKPPDPKETARVQGEMNKETAVAQYGLNATNRVGPDGTVTYDQIGKWEDGTPRFQQTTALSPEQQRLYNLSTQAGEKFGTIGNAQLDNVSGRLSPPCDLDDEAGKHTANMQRTFPDPEWDGRNEKLQTQLANRGLNPGSQAYKDATRDFSSQRDRAYDQMYLASRSQAVDEAQRERDQPLRELASLISGTQPNAMPPVTTPNAGIAPVDYTGLVQQNYQAQLQQSQSKMGGIFGMLSMLPTMGGWSDRRLKTDIEQIAKHVRGWGVYAFRYVWDEPGTQRVGYMADEVAKIAPHAVSYHGGFAMVDYGVV